MTTPTTEESTLRLTRTLKAPREKVFEAFSTLDAMKEWFGPEGCALLGGELDFTPGGSYRLQVQTDSFGEVTLTGKYEEIVAPERLVYTWNWQGAEALEFGETRVTIELVDQGESTELKLTHEGFPAAEIRDNHDEGWSGTFDRLTKYVE